MGMFSKLWAWIKAFGSDALVFLTPFGKLLAKSGGQALLTIALDAATTMAATNMTSSEKRDEALKMIGERAKATGLNAGENAMRAVLELAVAKLKDQ